MNCLIAIFANFWPVCWDIFCFVIGLVVAIGIVNAFLAYRLSQFPPITNRQESSGKAGKRQ